MRSSAALTCSGLARQSASASKGKEGPEARYTLLTGFEDTEMADNGTDLSGTQYGQLR